MIVMKFELLPNEIIIECFEYLTIFNLLDSFDELNYRFTKLILNIPIHLNFEHIRRRQFTKFCKKILSNPEIKQQIYSIHLSNKNTCHQIEAFLYFSSPNEFRNLRSLTLIHIEQGSVINLKSMLPLSSKLSSFHLISPQTDENEIIAALPLSNLRKLSMLTLRSFLTYTQQTTTITHLTISNCSLEQLLYQLFKYVPMLKYLNVECISKYNRSITKNTILDRHNAIHLERLIIGEFKYPLKDFAILARQTPNLKNLTISTENNATMVDPYRWEDLIKCLLPYLTIFKFNFGCKPNPTTRNTVLQRFAVFQNEFWRKQHQWNTEVSILDKNIYYIYTVPYLSNTFKLESNSNRSCNKFVDKLNTFNKVNNLILNHKQIIDKCLFHFSNVTSLTLVITGQDTSVQIQYMESLKMIVNLFHLKHLDISMYSIAISSGKLLDILKESTQLSSIKINPNDLTLLLKDEKLCKYLNKMIKKLDIYKYDHPSFNNLKKLKKFCKIFSNVEQLRCHTNEPKYIIFLLYRLTDLTTMYAYLSSLDNPTYFRSLLDKHSCIFKHMSCMKGSNTNALELFIWTDKNMY